jgi:hypothetical protein
VTNPWKRLKRERSVKDPPAVQLLGEAHETELTVAFPPLFRVIQDAPHLISLVALAWRRLNLISA